MAAVTICSDFGAPQNKVCLFCHCFLCFPIYLPWSDGIGCHGLIFWMLSFKPTFSFSSFTFTKRLFSSFLSAIRVVSFAYLRLLVFLPAILIPACASSSLALHMMYSAYKLNKQGDNIQPWRTPFPIWNQSVVPRPVLIVASWPAYRFLRSLVRWSDIPISWKNFPQFVCPDSRAHAFPIPPVSLSSCRMSGIHFLRCSDFNSGLILTLALAHCRIQYQQKSGQVMPEAERPCSVLKFWGWEVRRGVVPQLPAVLIVRGCVPFAAVSAVQSRGGAQGCWEIEPWGQASPLLPVCDTVWTAGALEDTDLGLSPHLPLSGLMTQVFSEVRFNNNSYLKGSFWELKEMAHMRRPPSARLSSWWTWIHIPPPLPRAWGALLFCPICPTFLLIF